MSDYISRQAAIIEMMDNNVDHAQGTDGREVVQILSDIPAADVVPVVRCKDCRKCIYDSLFDQLWCNMTPVTRRVKPDDFCSYGKKKSESMTYKDVYQRFVEKYPNMKVVGYRPLTGDILPRDGVGIVVFLENGDSLAYVLEPVEED